MIESWSQVRLISIYAAVHTGALGDGADEHGWDGHEDAADGGHVRQDLRATSRLAAQHALEIHLVKTEELNSLYYLPIISKMCSRWWVQDDSR